MQPPRTTTSPPAALELGEFVRGLAHDIANPLNAMAMNAELTRVLLERGDSAAARDALDRLLSDTARCGRLVQSFRALWGEDVGRMMCTPAPDPTTETSRASAWTRDLLSVSSETRSR